MGDTRHFAVVITATDEASVLEAHEMAGIAFPGQVSEVLRSRWNAYWTFFIGPLGSSIGRAPYLDYEEKRNAFIQRLSDKIEISWAELYYGCDQSMNAEVTRHEDSEIKEG